MSLKSVIAAAFDFAGAADDLSRRFARELGKVLRDTERNLRPVIETAAEGSPTAIVKATRATRTRREIRTALQVSGYDTLAAAATGEPLDELTDALLKSRRLARQSAALSEASAIRLVALRSLYETDLLDIGDSVALSLWRATVRGIFGSRGVGDILADLAVILDDSEAHIRTLYDTSIAIYGRQVEALQAGDEPDLVFAYLGPADKKTRPFCLKHVGKVYTRAEIDALDNGQLDNVFLTGGGYQCRHVWIEVSRFSELRDYLDTGKRVPEIEAELADLGAAA